MIDDTYYDGHTFENITLDNLAPGKREYIACVFRNCVFNSINLSDCVFEQCQFYSCALITPTLNNTRLIDVLFDECKIVGAMFGALNAFVISFALKRSVIMSCSFSDMSLVKMSFENSKMQDVSFLRCNLTAANFFATVFEGGQFSGCDLRAARFIDASGFHINPNDNKLKNAVFNYHNAVQLLNSYQLKIL